jgi:hypothetical protein
MIQDISTGWSPAALQPSRPQPAPSAAGGSTSVVAASATRDIDASLSITTKEGDTFSISASFDTSMTYAGIRGRGEHGNAWSISSSSQVSMQVQGNLNEQEMKDISRIVKTFLHDLRSMLKGRDVSVANVAEGNPSTLESVSATASSNTTVTAVAVGSTPALREFEGPRPLRPTFEDFLLRRDVGRSPVGVAVPLPAPTPFTPAVTPAVA